MKKIQFVTYLTDLEKAALQATAAQHHLTASEWSRKVLLRHAIDETLSTPPQTPVETKTPSSMLFDTIEGDDDDSTNIG